MYSVYQQLLSGLITSDTSKVRIATIPFERIESHADRIICICDPEPCKVQWII